MFISTSATLARLVLASLIVANVVIADKVDKAKKSDVEDWNNEGINWLDEDHGWEESVNKAKEEGKPILLLVHRTWCGACKQLRPNFARSKDIEKLSGDFVMLRSAGEVTAFDHERFKPDGGYFPRILFFDSRGDLMEQVVQREDKYKYFHYGAESIVKAMKEAMEINAKRLISGEEEQVKDAGESEDTKDEL